MGFKVAAPLLKKSCGILLASLMLACDQAPGDGAVPVIDWNQISVIREWGTNETGNPLGVFTRVLDAKIVGDTLAVLDASAPYVRLFDSSGRFVRSIVREGKGPGEAKRPVSLGHAGSHAILITEPSQISGVGLDGRLIRRVEGGKYNLRGAVLGCADDLFVLGILRDYSVPEPSGVVLVWRGSRAAADTVARLGPMRPNTRRAHPVFADAHDDIVLYTEEVQRPRLMMLPCGSNDARSVDLDSLGRPQWWETLSENRSALHPPDPPHPAGLVQLKQGILWAVRTIVPTPRGIDSLTSITLIKSDSRKRRRIVIRGWFELLDADDRGNLLFAQNAPIPRVLLLSGDSTMSIVSRTGADVAGPLAYTARQTPQ